MNNLHIIISVSVLVSFLVGCGANKKLITIDDYIVGAEYEIVEVDGLPAERAKHGSFVTVVPLVQVGEGLHRLTVRYAKPVEFTHEYGAPEKIIVNVKEGKRYRVVRKNGKPVLVEKNELPESEGWEETIDKW
jgi:hypothetical protein